MFVIRHGEAEHNVAFQIEGPAAYKKYRDPSLTEKGKQQAKESGAELLSMKINMIITSPLQRCIETASILRTILHAPVFAVDGLIEEQGNGEICNERKSLQELMKHVTVFRCDDPFTIWDVYGSREPGDHVKERAEETILFCKQSFPNHRILFVTHHDVIKNTFGKSVKNCEWFSI